MPIEIPRDRDGNFEPLIIPKGQTRFPWFDDREREVQSHLEEIDGVEGG